MKKLSIFDKIIYVLNALMALVLLVSIVVPYIPTKFISSLSFVSLIVPITVIVNFVFVLYWMLRRKPNFMLSGVLLIICYFLLGPFYQFSSNVEVKEDGENLKVMSFNARGFNMSGQLNEDNIEGKIYDLVSEANPDIVCFQESYYAMKRNNALPQYEYKYIDFFYGEPRGTKVIQSIYSKYPIIKVDSIPFPKSSNNAIYADILFHKDTLRIYNLHLQSFRIIPEISAIQNEETKKLFGRLSNVMGKQYEQADLVRKNMHATHYKKIVLGDFNNTQYSNIYKAIKGDMEDTFLEKGKGFGRTYEFLQFPLRIDYILADPDFEVLSHQNFDEKLSDHYPVMATLRLTSHE